MTNQQISDTIKFPEIPVSASSLSVIEKSLLGHFLLLNQPRTVVELGVYHAETTLFMCEFLEMNSIDATLYGFDIPDVIAECREQAQVQAYEASGKLELIGGWLPQSLEDWLQTAPQIDVILIDAEHTYGAVLGELERVWGYVREGGFVLCHDYTPYFPGVQTAVDHFVRKAGANMLPLHSTTAAMEKGHKSGLVALAKPVVRYSKLKQLNLHWRNRLRFMKRLLGR